MKPYNAEYGKTAEAWDRVAKATQDVIASNADLPNMPDLTGMKNLCGVLWYTMHCIGVACNKHFTVLLRSFKTDECKSLRATGLKTWCHKMSMHVGQLIVRGGTRGHEANGAPTRH